MAHFWWLVLAILGVAGYFYAQYLRTENGIKSKDTLKLTRRYLVACFASSTWRGSVGQAKH